MQIEKATKSQAKELANLINLAGEGIPVYFWSQHTSGNETAFDIGEQRAAREDGNFSYTNSLVCMEDNKLVGMVLSYSLPDPYTIGDITEYPDVVKPMVLLESKAPGSWYINALATYPPYWGKGIASRLLAAAEQQAVEHACKEISIIVSSENTRAKRLYEFLGFNEIARLPIVPFPGWAPDADYVLLIKTL